MLPGLNAAPRRNHDHRARQAQPFNIDPGPSHRTLAAVGSDKLRALVLPHQPGAVTATTAPPASAPGVRPRRPRTCDAIFSRWRRSPTSPRRTPENTRTASPMLSASFSIRQQGHRRPDRRRTSSTSHSPWCVCRWVVPTPAAHVVLVVRHAVGDRRRQPATGCTRRRCRPGRRPSARRPRRHRLVGAVERDPRASPPLDTAARRRRPASRSPTAPRCRRPMRYHVNSGEVCPPSS